MTFINIIRPLAMNNKEIELQIKNDFAVLCDVFNAHYEKSQNKEQLLTIEINKHELLFDSQRLPLQEKIHSNRRPIKGLRYTDGDILQIREAYNNYIVYGADIMEAGDYYYVSKKDIKEGDFYIFDGKGRAAKKFPPSDINLHYFKVAAARFQYLKYLKTLIEPKMTKRTEVTTLEEACTGDNCRIVKEWFISNKYCDADPFRYNTGKYTLSELAGILKGLHKTELSIKLHNNEIKAIAKNSFRVEMSKDTIKHGKQKSVTIKKPGIAP